MNLLHGTSDYQLKRQHPFRQVDIIVAFRECINLQASSYDIILHAYSDNYEDAKS